MGRAWRWASLVRLALVGKGLKSSLKGWLLDKLALMLELRLCQKLWLTIMVLSTWCLWLMVLISRYYMYLKLLKGFNILHCNVPDLRKNTHLVGTRCWLAWFFFRKGKLCIYCWLVFLWMGISRVNHGVHGLWIFSWLL